MSDILTITGVVGSDPKLHVTPDGLSIATFRLASTQRRFDRAEGRWIDGNTNWYTVSTFRQASTNVSDSIRKGERVVVTGRLRIREWATGEKSGTNIDLEADALGHDLAWGRSSFTRNISTSATAIAPEQEAADSADSADAAATLRPDPDRDPADAVAEPVPF